jgi:hypothetical protein
VSVKEDKLGFELTPAAPNAKLKKKAKARTAPETPAEDAAEEAGEEE